MKTKMLGILAGLMLSTATSAEEITVPNGVYAQWMADGKCVAFTVKEGLPVKFVIADGCENAIAGTNLDMELKGKKLKVKKVNGGLKFTFGTASYVIKVHDRGLLDGTWSYNGWKGDVKFLVRPNAPQ